MDQVIVYQNVCVPVYVNVYDCVRGNKKGGYIIKYIRLYMFVSGYYCFFQPNFLSHIFDMDSR